MTRQITCTNQLCWKKDGATRAVFKRLKILQLSIAYEDTHTRRLERDAMKSNHIYCKYYEELLPLALNVEFLQVMGQSRSAHKFSKGLSLTIICGTVVSSYVMCTLARLIWEILRQASKNQKLTVGGLNTSLSLLKLHNIISASFSLLNQLV